MLRIGRDLIFAGSDDSLGLGRLGGIYVIYRPKAPRKREEKLCDESKSESKVVSMDR